MAKHPRKQIEIKAIEKVEAKIAKKANKGGLFKFIDTDGKQYNLTLKEKKFCELYIELNGNGADAIIEAGYNVTYPNSSSINRTLARNMASEYLAKPSIFGYVNHLLNASGFNPENVAKQHAFLINQHSDLASKSRGIDMFYKRFGLYPKDQAIMDALTKYKNMPDAELDAIIEGDIISDE